MKRQLLSLTFISCLLSFSPIGVLAQTGLKMNDLFQGRIIPQERMVETRVRGKSLEKYHLTFYRSLRMNVTPEECTQLGQLLDKDKAVSIDLRSHRDNPHSWKTYTCKMQLPPSGGKSRYLCYREQWNARHDQCEVTVIYMEGTVSSLEQLEKLLK